MQSGFPPSHNNSNPKQYLFMKRLLTLALSLFCLANLGLAQADDIVQVDNIKFKNLREDWVQMEVSLRANRNTMEGARNERFVDNIIVTGYFAYEVKSSPSGFEFYKAQVEVISIEQGKKQNVYFFMPGVVAERDRLPKTPEYYFVSLEVNGQIMKMTNNAYSSKLNETSIVSMKNRADAEADKNQFILKPHYSAPLTFIGADMDKVAPLIIPEPKR